MAQVIIGLDLGWDAVKAAVLKTGGRRTELLDMHHRRVLVPDPELAVPISSEEGNDGEAPEPSPPPARILPPEVLEATADVLQAIDEPQAAVVASVPAQYISTWRIDLPFTDPRTIAKVLPGELATQAPFDIDSMVLDWRILETREDGVRVLAALVPEDAVREVLDGLASLGVDPRHLRVDAFALANLLDQVSDGPTTSALVDLGRRRSIVAMRGQGASSIRVIDRGGDDLTAALAETTGLSRAEAEEHKRTGVSLNAPTPSGKATFAATEPLVASLKTTLMAFETGGSTIDKLFLSGGCSRVEGLVGLLQESLGVPVDFISRVPSLGAQAPTIPPEHTLALALALSGTPEGLTDAVELRRGTFAYRRDTRRLQALGLGAVGLLLAFALFSVVSFFVEQASLKSQTAELKEKITNTVQGSFPDVPDSVLTTSTGAVAVMMERTTALGSNALQDPFDSGSPLVLLRDLSALLTSDLKINVDQFRVDDDGVRLTCRTESLETADQVLDLLQQDPRFAKAQKGDQSRDRTGQARFTITMPLPGNEEGS